MALPLSQLSVCAVCAEEKLFICGSVMFRGLVMICVNKLLYNNVGLYAL